MPEGTAPAPLKKPRRWWRAPWLRRLALACAGAALGASCSFAPEWARPACEAVARTLHAAGVP